MLLHSFRHRTYWFRVRVGSATAIGFQRLVEHGETVLEPAGKSATRRSSCRTSWDRDGAVVVFESGNDILPYLRSNIDQAANVQIIEAAAGVEDGWADFLTEHLTGQNSSPVTDYQTLVKNERSTGVSAKRRVERVRVRSVDRYVQYERLDVGPINGFWVAPVGPVRRWRARCPRTEGAAPVE